MREPMVARIRSGQSRRRPPDRPATAPSQKASLPIPMEVTSPRPVTTTPDFMAAQAPGDCQGPASCTLQVQLADQLADWRALMGGSFLGGALGPPAEGHSDMGGVPLPGLVEDLEIPEGGKANRHAQVQVRADAVEEPSPEPEPVGPVLVRDLAPSS